MRDPRVDVSYRSPKLGQVLGERIVGVFHHRRAAAQARSQGELLFQKAMRVRHCASLLIAAHNAGGATLPPQYYKDMTAFDPGADMRRD